MRYLAILATLGIFLFLALNGCTPEGYDLVIRGATVYDGTGTEGKVMDVGIIGDEIAAVGKNLKGTAGREIDAAGMALAPGFIDLHTHLEALEKAPEGESHLRMGVTTALGGPDGGGPLPFGPYLDSLEALGPGLNVAYLAGHNEVRKAVMGLENRNPTDDELQKMKGLVSAAMDEGAFGISTGLKYLPGAYSEIEEVIELSREAAAKGGFYTSHLREEGLGLLEGVQEAIVIAEQAEIPVVLTHHKVVGYPMWGSSVKTLAMVDSARAAGLDVMIDQYPYTASFTGLSILIPAWSMAGGPVREFARRCQDPVLRDSIKRGIVFNLINDRGGNDLSRVQFSSFPYRPEFDGKTLRDWAEAEGLEPTMENGAELIIEAQINGGARCIFHAMDEGDVARIMQHPQTMIASDGRLNRLGEGHPHPRVYGTFPRVLGLYVREKQLLTLEEAIRKMSGLPAQRLGLTDRGLIKAGFKADLVIFDPQTVQDQAGFTDPHHFPIGIPYVLLNGRLVVDDNTFHDLRAGKVLRGPAYQSGK